MSTTTTAPASAADIVTDYFGAPIRTLTGWVAPFAAQVAQAQASGPLTRARLDALVEPHALNTLDLPESPVYGAGFIAAICIATSLPIALNFSFAAVASSASKCTITPTVPPPWT